jgi:hypothetical protein
VHMPGTAPTQPAAISFGPKRVEQRQEQTVIQKLTVFLLVLAFLSAGAAIGYRYYSESKLAEIQSQIADAEDDFTTEAYDNIRSFDREVRAARFMLGNRMDHTRIFDSLEDSVSQSVFYQSFESIIDETGNVALSLSGVSPEFAKVVLQSSALGGASLLTDVEISRIEIKKGDVTDEALFEVRAAVSRDKLLRGASDAQVRTAPPQPAATESSVTVPSSDPETLETAIQ